MRDRINREMATTATLVSLAINGAFSKEGARAFNQKINKLMGG